MKNIMILGIIAIIVCSSVGVLAVPVNVERQSTTIAPVNSDFTHTVFAEDGTATWCGYCIYAHGALEAIYAGGWYPFYYVTLVDDRNTHADDIIMNYNIRGFPTVWFDGGYQVNLGAGGVSSAMAKYNSSIIACGARPVPTIITTLNVTWLGDAAMDISASVRNDDSTPYAGHIRVYVTEVRSSMGWKDASGKPYTFPFLEYAFNQDIAIPGGDTWTATTRWDGHDYNNGYGQDFGSVKSGNIMVIAAVFNATKHTGYSSPPDEHPFDAYYVDDATAFFVGDNNQPTTPTISGPSRGKPGDTIEYTIKATDLDKDTLRYYIDWGDNSTSEWIGPYPSGQQVPLSHSWTAKGTYTIKAKAKDIYGAESDWGTLEVTMPASSNTIIEQFFNHILNRFPLLKHLLSLYQYTIN